MFVIQWEIITNIGIRKMEIRNCRITTIRTYCHFATTVAFSERKNPHVVGKWNNLKNNGNALPFIFNKMRALQIVIRGTPRGPRSVPRGSVDTFL
jgi:hypothetical protein